MFQAQTKSFDDDFDTDSEDEIPAQKSVAKKGEPVKNEEDEDDSDFEDPDPGEFGNNKMGKNSDAAFLYVLFVFQFFVTVFGLYKFFRKS